MRSTLSRIFSPSLGASCPTAGNSTISLPAFGKEQLVAELDLPLFAADNHIDVRFVGTEDFVRIVDLASADDARCLFDNLREQFEFFANRREYARPVRCCNVCPLAALRAGRCRSA